MLIIACNHLYKNTDLITIDQRLFNTVFIIADFQCFVKRKLKKIIISAEILAFFTINHSLLLQYAQWIFINPFILLISFISLKSVLFTSNHLKYIESLIFFQKFQQKIMHIFVDCNLKFSKSKKVVYFLFIVWYNV